MILHFSQIGFTDGLTFMLFYLHQIFGGMGHRKPVRRPLARRSHAYLRPLFILLGTPSDTTAGQVVRRHLNGDLVAGKNADKVHAELARDTVSYTHLDVYKRQSEMCAPWVMD